MAVESKPLFHPEVMRQQVRGFNLPEHVAACQPKLRQWADLIASGGADEHKETALLPDFLTDIFCGLLGYTGPAGVSGVAADVSRRHSSGEQRAPTDVGGYPTRSAPISRTWAITITAPRARWPKPPRAPPSARS
jgi:hypothetical protein